MISLQIDLNDAMKAAEVVAATNKQVKAARNGALTDTSKSATTFIKKRVSVATKIAQKRLGVRVKSRRYDEDGTVKIWIGADPVPVHTIGKLRWNTRSVVAGRVVRRGAFLAHIGGGGLRTFIREASDHYVPDLYSDTSYGVGYKKSRWGSISSRFPVRLAVVHIDDVVEEVLNELDTELQNFFDKNFSRRLNYEVNVKGAN